MAPQLPKTMLRLCAAAVTIMKADGLTIGDLKAGGLRRLAGIAGMSPATISAMAASAVSILPAWQDEESALAALAASISAGDAAKRLIIVRRTIAGLSALASIVGD